MQGDVGGGDRVSQRRAAGVLAQVTPKPYRGISIIRKRTPVGHNRRPMPRILGGSYGGGRFLIGGVPLQTLHHSLKP